MGTLPHWPEPDSKVELGETLLQGGGPVATALVSLARLGASAAILGRVGDDEFGDRIRTGLAAEGVDCRGLEVDPGRSSQFAFIAVAGDGKRTIFWHRGSARPLAAEEVDPLFVRSCRVLHLDGLHLDSALAAARIARSAGVVTVLDGGTLREGAEALLPLIDHLVVSEKFARQLAGCLQPRDVPARLLAYGAKAATVTLGEGGSWSQIPGAAAFHQPAFAVSAVDTTGCGDVFHGGYIFGLLRGWDLPRTVRFAAACAALKTRALGGRTAIPTLPEVLTFLHSNS